MVLQLVHSVFKAQCQFSEIKSAEEDKSSLWRLQLEEFSVTSAQPFQGLCLLREAVPHCTGHCHKLQVSNAMQPQIAPKGRWSPNPRCGIRRQHFTTI